MSTGYHWESRPRINWNHVDGPMLTLRCGTVHWLTLWERVQMRFGWTNIYKLERKHWPTRPEPSNGIR